MGPITPPELTASLSAYAAPERRAGTHQEPPRERFAPLWLRASLILATVVTMALLYPKSYIENNLRQQSQPSATTLAYLRLMVAAQPSALDARILLAQQALTAGDLSEARDALAPWLQRPISALPLKVALLRLRLVSAELDATRPSTPRHAEVAEIYLRELLLMAPRMDSSELLPVARFIAGQGQYRIAADLYRRIIAQSPDAPLRLEAFHRGIEALLAAGQPADALAFAQHELTLVPPSAALWREMTQLALAADAPELAARYARRLTGLKAP
jgi:polysaccharide biosynthesis protein PelB